MIESVRMVSAEDTVAVVLAGGQSRRMAGTHKIELMLGGEPLLGRVIRRVQPQVGEVILNLNRSPEAVDIAPFRRVADLVEGFPGPLTGLVSGYRYLLPRRLQPSAILIVPCDGPFVPDDLAARLAARINTSGAEVACARYGGEAQPTFSLWRFTMLERAWQALTEGAEGGFKGLLARCDTVYEDWRETVPEPFFNINTPEDLRRGEALVAEQSGLPRS